MQITTTRTGYAIAKALSEFWLPHLQKTEDLFKHLEYVDASDKEIRKEALRLELLAFDDKLAAEVPRFWRFKEYRRRTIVTLLGEITYLRRIYQEPSGICHAYLDEVLGIRSRMKLAPDAFIWIVKKASDVSFRNTAKAFLERTGAKISHWLVMACVREEGTLILEEAYEKACGKKKDTEGALPLSSETLFVEFDGVHIPLQKTTHSPRKARWLYEQNRKKHSFELKVGCFYAGKNDKGARVGCAHFALDAHPSYFWPLFNAKIASVYDTEVISTLYSSADAAGWCKAASLDALAKASKATHHLDRFHLNREIRRAFGGRTSKASHFISLAYKRKTKRLIRDLQLVINHAKGKAKERYLDLFCYLKDNLELLEAGPGPSMGTMEGTNAHVYAARMKVWGGAWSRRGGACMAAIRAHLASGEDLIVPPVDNVLYDDYQIARRLAFEESRISGKWKVPESEGTGYEPPRGEIVLSTHLPSHLYGILNYT